MCRLYLFFSSWNEDFSIVNFLFGVQNAFPSAILAAEYWKKPGSIHHQSLRQCQHFKTWRPPWKKFALRLKFLLKEKVTYLFHVLHKDVPKCFTIVPALKCTSLRLMELLQIVEKRSFMFEARARVQLRNIFTVQWNIASVDKAQKDLSHVCPSSNR